MFGGAASRVARACRAISGRGGAAPVAVLVGAVLGKTGSSLAQVAAALSANQAQAIPEPSVATLEVLRSWGINGERAADMLVDAHHLLSTPAGGRQLLRHAEHVAYCSREALDSLMMLGGDQEGLNAVIAAALDAHKAAGLGSGSPELDRAMDALEEAYTSRGLRNRKRLEAAIRLVTRRQAGPAQAAMITRWRQLTSQAAGELHGGDVAANALGLYLNTLAAVDALFAPFGQRIPTLDQLARLQHPSGADAAQVAGLGDPRHVEYFFAHAESSAWLALLDDELLRPDATGWPSLPYLRRLVDHDPNLVLSWLLSRVDDWVGSNGCIPAELRDAAGSIVVTFADQFGLEGRDLLIATLTATSAAPQANTRTVLRTAQTLRRGRNPHDQRWVDILRALLSQSAGSAYSYTGVESVLAQLAGAAVTAAPEWRRDVIDLLTASLREQLRQRPGYLSVQPALSDRRPDEVFNRPSSLACALRDVLAASLLEDGTGVAQISFDRFVSADGLRLRSMTWAAVVGRIDSIADVRAGDALTAAVDAIRAGATDPDTVTLIAVLAELSDAAVDGPGGNAARETLRAALGTPPADLADQIQTITSGGFGDALEPPDWYYQRVWLAVLPTGFVPAWDAAVEQMNSAFGPSPDPRRTSSRPTFADPNRREFREAVLDHSPTEIAARLGAAAEFLVSHGAGAGVSDTARDEAGPSRDSSHEDADSELAVALAYPSPLDVSTEDLDGFIDAAASLDFVDLVNLVEQYVVTDPARWLARPLDVVTALAHPKLVATFLTAAAGSELRLQYVDAQELARVALNYLNGEIPTCDPLTRSETDGAVAGGGAARTDRETKTEPDAAARLRERWRADLRVAIVGLLTELWARGDDLGEMTDSAESVCRELFDEHPDPRPSRPATAGPRTATELHDDLLEGYQQPWGLALRALCEAAAQHVSTSGSVPDWFVLLTDEVIDWPRGSTARQARAILASRLAKVVTGSDQDWLHSRADRLFGRGNSASLGRATAMVYLRMSHTIDPYFTDLLWNAVIQAAKEMDHEVLDAVAYEILAGTGLGVDLHDVVSRLGPHPGAFSELSALVVRKVGQDPTAARRGIEFWSVALEADLDPQAYRGFGESAGHPTLREMPDAFADEQWVELINRTASRPGVILADADFVAARVVRAGRDLDDLPRIADTLCVLLGYDYVEDPYTREQVIAAIRGWVATEAAVGHTENTSRVAAALIAAGDYNASPS